jgi:hypothetical protein
MREIVVIASSVMANAGYAAGTVLAVQFSQLLPQRRMLLVYGTMLVAGLVLAAAATSPGDVHRRARAAGFEHQPAADRGGASALPGLPSGQAALDG